VYSHSLTRRCFLLSLLLTFQGTERYHEDNIDCEPTKKKHSATEQAIKDDQSRHLGHLLLIFPKDVRLENHIFSDDAVQVRLEVNDMEATIDNEGEDLDVMGTTLFWQIAVAGGSKLASGGSSKKVKKLFKKGAVKKGAVKK
jgi:predicted metal-dependent RNase